MSIHTLKVFRYRLFNDRGYELEKYEQCTHILGTAECAAVQVFLPSVLKWG